MQTTTLTITTERVKAGSDLFRLTSYEMKTEAICDICGTEASGADANLRRSGWHLGQNEQFCPECNY